MLEDAASCSYGTKRYDQISIYSNPVALYEFFSAMICSFIYSKNSYVKLDLSRFGKSSHLIE